MKKATPSTIEIIPIFGSHFFPISASMVLFSFFPGLISFELVGFVFAALTFSSCSALSPSSSLEIKIESCPRSISASDFLETALPTFGWVRISAIPDIIDKIKNNPRKSLEKIYFRGVYILNPDNKNGPRNINSHPTVRNGGRPYAICCEDCSDITSTLFSSFSNLFSKFCRVLFSLLK